MDKARFDELYQKYLRDLCSAEELTEFFELYDQLDDADSLIDINTYQQLNIAEKHLPDKQAEKILQEITKPKHTVFYLKNYRLLAIASILIVSFFVGLFIWKNNNQPNKVYFSYYNDSSNTKIIQLEDGSKIYLKPQSSIVQTSDFKNDEHRSVQLEGEAFLSIAKRKNQPFNLISPNNLAIEVLGTRFYATFLKDKCEAVLTEGSIAVALSDQRLLLSPSEMVSWTKQDRTLEKQRVDTLRYTSWMDHKLYFKDDDLAYVIEQLNSTYPEQQISISKQFETLKFTGYLPTNNQDQCLEILQTTFDIYNLHINFKK